MNRGREKEGGGGGGGSFLQNFKFSKDTPTR